MSSGSEHKYYEEKTTLVSAEIARRAESHELDMKIKREELAMKQEERATKQQMTAFWTLATQKLSANEIRIGDIVSVAAIQSQPQSFSPIEIINLDAAEMEQPNAEVRVQQQESTTLSTLGFVHQSPFRVERMYERDESEAGSETPSLNDDEQTDPSFQFE